MTLDDIDLKILDLLCLDGRLSHTAIGKKIELTGPAVYARIQRLEREGIIEGYTTRLNAEKIGRGLAAFIRVGMHETPEGTKRFEEFILQEPQILECHDVSGEDCYILKVRTVSPQTLRTLLSQIRGLPGVTHTITSIALTTVKEELLKSPETSVTRAPEGSADT
ncbi:Lrp/AsnC family transcriptional regulator [Ktedonosporobacter rubrisoli]|uniref:Lrp/AsnC family transcriptional regulator n=1 Tax=Ktedonosporobacter rubrisoli TaxID=2509675 RepID=A0A4V0YYI3_KTERU|nr:Lrp/AsnC family transcriptional regulator [Ktedonosporobacter rubrisoli]QBD76321.1 Lrp/AsnC family transcriptional regulator [Ktedonosporobacter rubrisoli]